MIVRRTEIIAYSDKGIVDDIILKDAVHGCKLKDETAFGVCVVGSNVIQDIVMGPNRIGIVAGVIVVQVNGSLNLVVADLQTGYIEQFDGKIPVAVLAPVRSYVRRFFKNVIVDFTSFEVSVVPVLDRPSVLKIGPGYTNICNNCFDTRCIFTQSNFQGKKRFAVRGLCTTEQFFLRFITSNCICLCKLFRICSKVPV